MDKLIAALAILAAWAVFMTCYTIYRVINGWRLRLKAGKEDEQAIAFLSNVVVLRALEKEATLAPFRGVS